jgi:acyl carrier protein
MQTAITRDQVAQTLCRLAAEQVGADPALVALDTDFFNDLNYDSLDAVEFTMTVEETFDVSVPDDQIEDVRTAGRVLELLWPILEQKHAAPAVHNE